MTNLLEQFAAHPLAPIGLTSGLPKAFQFHLGPCLLVDMAAVWFTSATESTLSCCWLTSALKMTKLWTAYTVKNAHRFPGFPWNLSFLITQNTHLLLAENFAHSPSWILSFSSSKKCSATWRGTKFRAEEWNPPPPERQSRKYSGNLAEARKYLEI